MRPTLSRVLLACALLGGSTALAADDTPPAFAGKDTELLHLDNGMVVEGRDIETLDGHTSGFRVIAGYSPLRLSRLDLGAELSYRESDEVPIQRGEQQLLYNSVSLGGSLVAGVRLGRFGIYAKSGIAGWEGTPVIPLEGLAMAGSGTTRVQGFGARLQLDRLVSRLEFEEFDAPDMAHLNLWTASLHLPF